jgi:16S rRNA (uracil1498-N3)-methyltransferase
MHNRFFINSFFNENNFSLSKMDSHHIINVLRLKNYDIIEVCWIDKIYLCEIQIIKNIVNVIPNKFINDIVITKPNITLIQSIPKFNKMDNLIEKCTELGINKIIPVFTERVEKNQISSTIFQRWQKIILSAAKQSKRDYIPKLIQPVNLKNSLNLIDVSALKILFFELSKYNLSNFNYSKQNEIVYFIGPEGSITESEYYFLKDNNFIELKLNLPILKVDTAAITALVTILNLIKRI